MTNLLHNPGFEADWGAGASHEALICRPDTPPYQSTVGNIFTPSGGWLTWFKHDPGTFDQPEVRDAWAAQYPRRVHSGEKAILLFTFNRRHDAGFLQQVQVEPGQRLRLTAFAHAWSNHNLEGHAGCADDGRCSCGVGREVVAIRTDEVPPLNGDPWNDARGNFAFTVGIDPTGGIDPRADTVEWGTSWAIYNGYCQQLSVEAEARAETVTAFLRSTTMWRFKHNDAYWDDAALVVVEEEPPEPPPPEERGLPRVQYERTYTLLPPDADAEWALAVIDATWDAKRFTIGGSADDAGIGDLDYRRIIAVNPGGWPSDLADFYAEHYPGVEYIPIKATTPKALREALEGLE